jgi:hypothetical protein
LEEDVLAELQRALATVFDAEIIAVPGVPLPRNAERLLGVVDVDRSVPELNFVFGEADTNRGRALASREQRIDVTGHVASGFIKCVENGITEPAAFTENCGASRVRQTPSRT